MAVRNGCSFVQMLKVCCSKGWHHRKQNEQLHVPYCRAESIETYKALVCPTSSRAFNPATPDLALALAQHNFRDEQFQG